MGLFSFLKEKFSKGPSEKSEKYDRALKKSRANFASRLEGLTERYEKANGMYFEEIEQILIEADVGVELTFRLVESLIAWADEHPTASIGLINEELIDKMFVSYVEKGDSISNDIQFSDDGPTVVLVEGVNGVGKTTSIAKLAKRYIDRGKKVLLVAADTFRAGAREQLTIWANRLNCPIVVGKPNSDPASVCYDGAKKALEDKIDLVIVDTAGRLQNKQNLMAELAKMKRVLEREIPNAPHETFLIIDATTGQNGVSQAKSFSEVSDITGIIITKMDGTSKGGIILSVRDEIGAPVRFVGLGEKMDDLEEFDLDEYLHALLIGEKDGR